MTATRFPLSDQAICAAFSPVMRYLFVDRACDERWRHPHQGATVCQFESNRLRLPLDLFKRWQGVRQPHRCRPLAAIQGAVVLTGQGETHGRYACL